VYSDGAWDFSTSLLVHMTGTMHLISINSNELQPASTIPLPVHTLIQLTIISYDTPTAGSTDAEGKVSGTVGGTVLLINGTNAIDRTKDSLCSRRIQAHHHESCYDDSNFTQSVQRP